MANFRSRFPPCPYARAGVRNGQEVKRICRNTDKPVCGQEVVLHYCQQCKSPFGGTDSPPQIPSLDDRIQSYTKAAAEWIAAGRPARSDPEIEAIFNTHCKPCSWRKRKSNICRGCGCRVADTGFAVFNKIKMATQHCPRNKW
jgi:hypothetical protein